MVDVQKIGDEQVQVPRPTLLTLPSTSPRETSTPEPVDERTRSSNRLVVVENVLVNRQGKKPSSRVVDKKLSTLDLFQVSRLLSSCPHAERREPMLSRTIEVRL